jgi:fibronectin-binding autotransporter adhesin
MTKTLSKAVFTAMTFVGLLGIATPAKAQTDYYWNAPNGGIGPWDLTTQNWATLVAGPVDYTWLNNGNERANFGNTAGTVTLGTGITAFGVNFSTSGYIITGDTLTLAGAGGVVDTSTFDATINSIIGGAVGLTKSGQGTLTLGGANTYTGVTNVNAGAIVITNTTALGATGSGNETVIATGAAIHINNIINVADALTINGTGLSNDGALRKLGVNNAVWSGAITMASASRINSDGGLLTISGVFSGNQNLTIGGAGNTTISSAIAATAVGTITKDGAGTLTLTGSNAWTGALTINGGIVSIPATTALGTAGAVTLNGGTLRETNQGNAGSFISATRAINIGPNGGTVDYSPSGLDYSFVTIFTPNAGNAIKGIGNTLTKTGVGEFRYNGAERANTSFAKLVVNQGLFRLGDSGAGNNFEVGFGAAPASFLSDAITLNGGSIGASFTVTLNNNRGITLGPNGGTFNTSAATMTVPGVISGPGSLNKGTGTLTLSNTANTYTGRTSLAGTLAITSLADGGVNSAIGASTSDAANLVLHGGTLSYSGAATSTDRLFSITSGGGTLNSSGTGPINFTNTGSILAIDMPISNFTVQDTSTFVKLSTTGTAADMTGISVGMAVSGAGIPGGATVTAISPTLAQFTISAAATATTLNTPLTFTSLNRTLTLTGTNTGDNILAGALSNSPSTVLSVTKAGTGTWALTGVNTYTGATNINAGTLLANTTGSGNSATGTGTVSVNNNGTLGGSGNVLGNVNVNTGGRLMAGTGNVVNQTLTLGASTSNVTTIDVGSYYRAAVAEGSGPLDSSLTGASRAAVQSLDLTTAALTAPGGTPAQSVNFELVGTTSLQIGVPYTRTIGTYSAFGPVLTGANVTSLNITPGGGVTLTPIGFDINQSNWSIDIAGGNVIVSFTPVPEPTTILAVGALAFGLVRRLRRK